jgi:DNA (cytosine-5)-methyltransferase 1
VPVEGREGKSARRLDRPMRTMTTRNETALVAPSNADAFVAELRGGGSTARSVNDPLATVTASGNHHMLVRNNSTIPGSDPGYLCTKASEPLRALVAITNQSLVSIEQEIDDATFRMLEPHEIQSAMAFYTDYRVTGNRREKVRQLGNGVTPPAAEFLLSAVRDSLEAA